MNDYFNDLKITQFALALVCIASAAVSIWIVKSSFDEAESMRDEIFIADAQNTLLLARSNDIQTNRGNEAEAVVNKLHVHLFYMTPTSEAIENAIQNATALGDESVKQFCDKNMEAGWYNTMMAQGISTEFLRDSIVVMPSDKEGYDFFVRLYGKTSTIYTSAIEFRRIVTSCYVLETQRTVENPNGYICCLFNVEEDKVIRSFKRKLTNDSIR